MQERDFLSLTEPTQRAFRRHKRRSRSPRSAASSCSAPFTSCPSLRWRLIAAIFVVLTRCLDVEEARGAVQWRILYMIFGMLALGTAMETTGAAHLIASGVTGAVGRFGPRRHALGHVPGRDTPHGADQQQRCRCPLNADRVRNRSRAGGRCAAVCGRGHVRLRGQFSPPPSGTRPTPTFSARAVIALPISRKSARRSISSLDRGQSPHPDLLALRAKTVRQSKVQPL